MSTTPAAWAEAIRRFLTGQCAWECLDEEGENPLGHVVLDDAPQPSHQQDEAHAPAMAP